MAYNIGKFKNILTKNFLIVEYTKKKNNTTQIAQKVGCTYKAVLYHMNKYNIKRRTLSEAKKGLSKPKTFSQKISRIKKAYYISNPCFNKGANNGRYIDGRTKNPPLRYCLDCNKKISKKATRCKGCCSKGKLNPMFGKIAKHGKWGKYKGIKMRSSWEILYAKWLDKNKIKWRYESKTFDLGDTTYTPDFYLPERNQYIEVKGYWRDDAKKKFKLFKKKYPKINITVEIKGSLQRKGVLL